MARGHGPTCSCPLCIEQYTPPRPPGGKRFCGVELAGYACVKAPGHTSAHEAHPRETTVMRWTVPDA